MKNKEVFFNPFRLISPKLDTEASRLSELYEKPPEEVTCLEEGLLVMLGKLVELSRNLRKSLLMPDPDRLAECERLAKEIHEEEKSLTEHIVVCSPTETTGEVLKAVVLFPGRLERVGDHLESLVNVCRIKARDGIVFSDMANKELDQLFDLFLDVLQNFRDALVTRNATLLEHVVSQANKLAQMCLDCALAHEDRLLQGLCASKASSLYLDILYSMKAAKGHIREMSESLLALKKD